MPNFVADMPDQILSYFQKHKQIIEDNLRLSVDPDDIEAIHNFRLSVKRLRLLGKLAELISDQSFESKERLRKTNKLFQSSGRLRDVQVTRQLMEDMDAATLSAVIEQFRNREVKQRRKFEAALAKYDHNSLAEFETGLIDILDGVQEKQALLAGFQLLSILETGIKALYHSNNSEKRFHDIRTRLKDINYLNNIFDQSLPVQDHLNISIERLREVGELAGSWHDCLNLETKLGEYLKKKPEDSGSMQDVLLKLRTRKESLSQEYVCILLNEMKI